MRRSRWRGSEEEERVLNCVAEFEEGVGGDEEVGGRGKPVARAEA